MKNNNDKSTFTYLEYLEFSSVEEFEKFKDLEPITDEDINAIDWDVLTGKLEEVA